MVNEPMPTAGSAIDGVLTGMAVGSGTGSGVAEAAQAASTIPHATITKNQRRIYHIDSVGAGCRQPRHGSPAVNITLTSPTSPSSRVACLGEGLANVDWIRGH